LQKRSCQEDITVDLKKKTSYSSYQKLLETKIWCQSEPIPPIYSKKPRPSTSPRIKVSIAPNPLYNIATAAPNTPKATPAAFTTAFVGAPAVDAVAAVPVAVDPEVEAALAAVPVDERDAVLAVPLEPEDAEKRLAC
jgi:hypothetical protein